MIPLEVPVFAPSSASAAISAGAHRLELNRAGSYPQGGLTPEIADLQVLLRSECSVPLRIMIRPRGPPADGSPDFVYSNEEFDAMKASIREFQASGLMQRDRGDGFVFGIVRACHVLHRTAHGDRSVGEAMVVDVERNRELVDLAAPWPCVFHRAFDDILGGGGCPLEQALADLDRCSFRGVLTSGGPGSAVDNTQTLSEIIRIAPASLREIIVGGGVRSSSVQKLKGSLPKSRQVEVCFHSSCLTKATESDTVDEAELRTIVEELAQGGQKGER